MAHVAQMLTQEPIYKSSSIFCFKPILLSAYKLILLIYGDNSYTYTKSDFDKLYGKIGKAAGAPSALNTASTST